LIVNRGLGYGDFKIRLFNPPEISVITLSNWPNISYYAPSRASKIQNNSMIIRASWFNFIPTGSYILPYGLLFLTV
jgi:hypothetical protein